MQHPGSPCRPDGPILILTLDSFHKIREGEERGYDPSSSMPDAGIPAACREFLMAARAEVYRRLMNGEVVWEDSQREMGINRHLKAGRDLGGSDPSARYLPALHRYDGHFFDGLGEQGKAEFRQSRHHLLILSALYGFVRPFEPVQYYTCQFGEKNVSYGIWAEKNGISKVLAEYIRAHCIRRVFDFTACDVPAYHEIIDWEYVFRETGADVLHCYHRLTGTDKALKFFGIFVRRRMLPASPEELLAMQPGAVIDDILFSGMRLLKKSDPGSADDETLLALIMGGENESGEFKTSALW
ncbi:MAG: peroxide stress protein YaaA, partial [Methanomicrobiaceae archaeon]|nr:peroxide stress protein YaaA [Methanomicrobiaceae archaeon]